MILTVLYGFTKPMRFGLDGLAAYVQSGYGSNNSGDEKYRLRILDRIAKVRNTIRDLEKAFDGMEN